MGKVHPLDLAIGEQLKSQSPEQGIENGKRGTVATRSQLAGYRRSIQQILIEMVARIGRDKPIPEHGRIIKKSTKPRKRKRGPKVLTLNKTHV